MCARFEEWRTDIEKYCDENSLSFSKAEKMSRCWNDNMLVLQFYDPEKGKMGLLDETPMPAVLLAFRDGTGVRFEQTEYTKTYLAQ